MAAPVKKKAPAPQPEAVHWPFGKKNYIWFGIALATMIVGYVLLGSGSITMAPLLLVIAYCVLVPIAIMVKGRPDNDSPQDAQSGKS